MEPGNGHDDTPLGGAPDDERGEDLDDEPVSSGRRVPDPLDRVWLHPSELAALASFGPTAHGQSSGGSRPRTLTWLTPILAGAAGALLTVGVLAVTVTFDRSPANTARITGDAATNGAAGSEAATTRSVTIADTLASLSPSVVAIVARDTNGSRRGSAVCVRHGAQLLTSTRVVGSASTVEVFGPDGGAHTARVAGSDRVTGLALLDLEGDSDLPAARLADTVPARESAVWLLGAGAVDPKAPWMSGGLTSSNNAVVSSKSGPTASGLLETDAASGTAAIGGALVDGTGSVAGIVLGHVGSGTGTFAVSITVAVGVARQLDATGTAQHGSLGVRGIDTPAGPTVTAMPADAAATEAGIRIRDVIESVNGRRVRSMGEVDAVVHSLDPGRSVSIQLRRGTRRLDVWARLGAMTG